MQPPETRRRSQRLVPQKKKSPLPLIFAAGGGVLLLLILIIVAASPGKKHAKTVAPPSTPSTKKVEGTVRAEDCGSIMFVCAGSTHEDKEVVISICPGCGGRARFFWDYADTFYRCFACRKPIDRELVKCPDCGKLARKAHIKRM